MSYLKWFDAHALKHKKIVDKLIKKNYTNEQIVDYFNFENMVEKENDFCPLYKEKKKCHDIEKLNCYLCACPFFRFDDNGLENYNDKKVLSNCDINHGEILISGDVIHHNCSKCIVPHKKSFILKKFSLNWKEIMLDCQVT